MSSEDTTAAPSFVCPLCDRTFETPHSACRHCDSTLVVPLESQSVYSTVLPMCER